MTKHISDNDCTGHIENNTCTVCGVYHGDPCPGCGGRGFHASTCPAKTKITDRVHTTIKAGHWLLTLSDPGFGYAHTMLRDLPNGDTLALMVGEDVDPQQPTLVVAVLKAQRPEPPAMELLAPGTDIVFPSAFGDDPDADLNEAINILFVDAASFARAVHMACSANRVEMPGPEIAMVAFLAVMP